MIVISDMKENPTGVSPAGVRLCFIICSFMNIMNMP